MAKSFYERDQVAITNEFVKGNGVAYELGGVVGVESGLSVGWLFASGIALVVVTLLAWSPLVQSNSAPYHLLVALQAICTVLFSTQFIYRPVVVRTASGVKRLAAWQTPAERRRMADAFLAAKQAAT